MSKYSRGVIHLSIQPRQGKHGRTHKKKHQFGRGDPKARRGPARALQLKSFHGTFLRISTQILANCLDQVAWFQNPQKRKKNMRSAKYTHTWQYVDIAAGCGSQRERAHKTHNIDYTTTQINATSSDATDKQASSECTVRVSTCETFEKTATE